MAGENSAYRMLFLEPCFTLYIAPSATLSISSTERGTSVNVTTPILNVVGQPCFSISLASFWCSLEVTPAAVSNPTSGRRTTNSSPPMRATRSVFRRFCCIEAATVRRTSSPIACPNTSLIVLKLSKSMYAVVIDVCRRKWTAGSDGTMHFPFGQEAKKAGIHSARRVITARNILLSVQFLCLFYREHRDQKERQPDEAIPNQNPITRIFGAGQSVGYAPHHPPAVAIVTPSGKPANLLTRTIGIK